jgi:lipoyl(octanoyl) transferase
MTTPLPAIDLGRVPYRDALTLQREAVASLARGERGDAVYFLEHEPVLTVGRGGRAESFRLGRFELARQGIHVHDVERGGDVTYHGPGQIVAYPIVSLASLPGGRDLHRYLRDLEEVLIRALRPYGLSGARRPPYTGVWIGEQKIAAIGVAVRHWIAFHGFALNVDPDLHAFEWIHPCGIRDGGVASLSSLLGAAPERSEVVARLCGAFEEVWQRPVALAPTGAPLHA